MTRHNPKTNAISLRDNSFTMSLQTETKSSKLKREKVVEKQMLQFGEVLETTTRKLVTVNNKEESIVKETNKTVHKKGGVGCGKNELKKICLGRSKL